MKENDLIQVLWVEDDPNVINTYPLKAECCGLQLVQYSCWDDAKAALETDYDRWSAIILDAKCKYHCDSADNAIVFLREALKDVSVMAKEKHLIPWYVLTGGDESSVSDSINDERLRWDKDWTDSMHKKYYSKNIDNEMLFHRIKAHACISPRIRIQEMYRDVFEAMRTCGIDNKGVFALEDLLIPIHFSEEIEDKDYNDKFAKARDVLEYLFRSMSAHGVLPNWGKKVNLKWSNLILSGIHAKKKNDKGEEIVVIESKSSVAPPVIRRILREMVDVIPAFCHSDTEENGEIKKDEYLGSVSNSPLLLKSFALQLCDIVMWYNGYIVTHPNISDNKKAWEDKRNSNI